jgi:hypothetical protein
LARLEGYNLIGTDRQNPDLSAQATLAGRIDREPTDLTINLIPRDRRGPDTSKSVLILSIARIEGRR